MGYAASWQEAAQCQRIVIARGTEQTIGRMHLLIDVLPDGRLQLTNTSSRSTVQIENGPSITRGVPFQSEIPAGGLLLKVPCARCACRWAKWTARVTGTMSRAM